MEAKATHRFVSYAGPKEQHRHGKRDSQFSTVFERFCAFRIRASLPQSVTYLFTAIFRAESWVIPESRMLSSSFSFSSFRLWRAVIRAISATPPFESKDLCGGRSTRLTMLRSSTALGAAKKRKR